LILILARQTWRLWDDLVRARPMANAILHSNLCDLVRARYLLRNPADGVALAW
jgi:hypothetical protein